MNGALLISIVLGVAAAALGLLWLAARREAAQLRREKAEAEAAAAQALDEARTAAQERAAFEVRHDAAVQAGDRLREELSEAREVQNRLQEQRLAAVAELSALRASTDTEIAALRERAEADREAVEAERAKQEEAFRLQFKNLATEILGEQSKHFSTTSREQIELLLKPFRDNIADFRLRVEDIYNKQTAQGGELKAELKQLMELNRSISTEAQNLTSALKGNSKVQGDWGEMILDTILDSSNLVKGLHYITQDTIRTDEGNVRPDVILRLPDRKQIVIDSKTSLTAYAEYCAADASQQSRLLDAHVASVRKHVAELAAKSYQELLSASPDFVIMFIPSEPALLAVLQRAPEIWGEAYRKKVVISSPSNLFALLKLVDNLWQRNDLERNTRDIAECGSKIYDQLVAFAESMEGIEKGLKTAQGAYEVAYKRFTQGNNNLVRLGERMVGLHVKFKKQLPQPLRDAAELDDTPAALDAPATPAALSAAEMAAGTENKGDAK